MDTRLTASPNVAIISATIGLILVSFITTAFSQNPPGISLDKESYTWVERVYIKVENPSQAGSGFVFVSISTNDHSLDGYRLNEDASGSGIFTGEATLTGFEHQVFENADEIVTPETSGTGPSDGKLGAKRGDILRVKYEQGNSTYVDEAGISWMDGVITLDVSDCQPHTDCTVVVTDYDMNRNPENPDHLYEITVKSDSDPMGVTVTMVENGKNTGVFVGDFVITPNTDSVGQRLLARIGDTITAEYLDRTPSAPQPINEPRSIVSSSGFGVKENWALDEISRAGEDGITIHIEGIENYFPTVNKLEILLKANGIKTETREESGYYNKKLVLTKGLTFEITEPEQFEKVFGIDPKTFPRDFKGMQVNEAYIAERVRTTLQSCPPGGSAPDYCRAGQDQLEHMILNKVGTHHITESVILEQTRMNMTIVRPDLEAFTSDLMRVHNTGKAGGGSDTQFLLSQIGSAYQTSLIPDASGQQSGIFHVSIPPGTSLPGCENASECFIPVIIQIERGDTVVWSNDDSAAHTVTSGDKENGPDGVFNSNLIQAGASYEESFDKSGEYPYFCLVHPWMSGIVIVTPQDTQLPGEDPLDDSDFSQTVRFLNGFTLGYGFGKTWTYEYNVGFPVLYVEAHVEAGLGIGLRVPMDVKVEISKGVPRSPTSGTPYLTSLTMTTLDLEESEYKQILPFGKAFEGKEFNTYLGPAAHIEVELFGESVFDVSKGVPHPEGFNFVPPLGGEKVQFTEFDIDICETVDVCPALEMADLTLSAGVKGDMKGQSAVIHAVPYNSVEGDSEFGFSNNGEEKSATYHVTADTPLINIQNATYEANLQFIPRINAGIDTQYIPFSIEATVEFPAIEYQDILIGAHEGTFDVYTVPEFDALSAAILGAAIAAIVAFVRISRQSNLESATKTSLFLRQVV